MSIHKRKAGYQVMVDSDKGADGKRKRRVVGTFGSYNEADIANTAARNLRHNGIELSPNTVTVADLMARYLADADSRCGGKTMERYRELSRLYIEPHLGTKTLAKLKPVHVSAMCATLLASGGVKGRALSPKSVRHAFALLKAALAWAMTMEISMKNPAAAVQPPHAVRANARAFSAEEVARLLEAAAHSRWLPLLQFALATGARRGEIAALRWENVDFEQGFATIDAALSQTRTGVTVKSTKTERSRVVPLSKLGIDALRRQSVLQKQERLRAGGSFDDRGFVFTGPFGGMVKPMVITDAFRELARKAGLSIVSIHALRHTAATWMLAGGVDVRSAAGILGHSTPATTLGVYAHAIASAQVAAVETIEARLRRAKTGSE